jgi:hypothetical protein
MKSRWMVCGFALLIGCSDSSTGNGGASGSGGEAGTSGIGGDAGIGGAGGQGGMAGAGGEAGIEAAPMPFGSLSVSGDVEEWMENPFVPVIIDSVTFVPAIVDFVTIVVPVAVDVEPGKAFLAYWNFDAPERNQLSVAFSDELTTGSASVVQADLFHSGLGSFSCPNEPSEPCADVEIDMDARSMTFEAFRMSALHAGAEIFLTGTLYWE